MVKYDETVEDLKNRYQYYLSRYTRHEERTGESIPDGDSFSYEEWLEIVIFNQLCLQKDIEVALKASEKATERSSSFRIYPTG